MRSKYLGHKEVTREPHVGRSWSFRPDKECPSVPTPPYYHHAYIQTLAGAPRRSCDGKWPMYIHIYIYETVRIELADYNIPTYIAFKQGS